MCRLTIGGGENNNGWRIFTYKELQSATNGFSEDYKLGEGGFGSVYWGKTSDGLQVKHLIYADVLLFFFSLSIYCVYFSNNYLVI